MAAAALEGLKISDDKKSYIVEKLNPILEEMVTEVLTTCPPEPIKFMIDYMVKKGGGGAGAADAKGGAGAEENAKLKAELDKMEGKLKETMNVVNAIGDEGAAEKEEEEEEEEEDDDVDEIPESFQKPANQMGKCRASVSAEAYGAWNQKTAFTPPVHAKSDEQKGRLKDVLSKSFMFKALDDKEIQVLLDAMEEKKCAAKERPIKQGDDGDFLFVIETGALECYIKSGEGDDAKETMVKKVEAGDAFGELALLYNCPRAASVEAAEDSVLWKLDRDTFNHVVKDAASKKRERYEKFLSQVSLLSTMDNYQRSQVCDALLTKSVDAGAVVVKEADPGDCFYILEEGEAEATKADGSLEPMPYKSGDYFGELALLRDQPRSATVTAKTACKLLTLDRRAFKRLLGSVNEAMLTKAYN